MKRIRTTMINNVIFEKVNELTYLGAMLSVKNDWSREIGLRITNAERVVFALSKFLKSKCFSNKIKVRLCTAIIKTYINLWM